MCINLQNNAHLETIKDYKFSLGIVKEYKNSKSNATKVHPIWTCYLVWTLPKNLEPLVNCEVAT
jgi:hypothetical protein